MSIDMYAIKSDANCREPFSCCGFHRECTPKLECVRTGEFKDQFASQCALFKHKWHRQQKDSSVDFVPLHVHGTFSQKDGFGLPHQLVARAKEIGLKAIALTDHGNVTGHPQLEKACKKAELKPIYGCEFYMVPNKAKNTQKKNHITCLAKNLQGYQNLLALSTRAYREGNFYYMPTIDLRDLMEFKEGLVIMDGCTYGLISRHILDDNMEEAMRVAAWFKKQLGEDFYLEVQPLVFPDTHKVAEGKAAIGAKHNIQLVATNDVHYLEPGQEFIQNFLRMVRINGDVNNNQGNFDSHCYVTSGVEMAEWFRANNSTFDYRKAISNTVVICNKIEKFDLPKASPVRFPGVGTTSAYLTNLCREGWKKRNMKVKAAGRQQEYVDRLKYELQIIQDKDFVDYFLVVWDGVKWAKSTEPLPNSTQECKVPIMVGPARGSAAGSLVSYLIGITEVDPIEHELLFERFIDVSRPDPPDIDIDFQHDRRDEVKDYFKQKYGEEKVANLAGYTTWGAKSLLDDIGRCFKISKKDIEGCKDELVENGGTKTVKDILQGKWPELVDLHKVEDMIRGYTVHAAGVIVSSEDITKFGTIGRDGILMDKRDAEYVNLLKIDALSLKTLTIIKHCLDVIGKDSEWLYSLPLDDPETIAGFNSGKFMGVFQFEGDATKGVCRQLQVNDFNTTMDITSLSRPGPLQSGATRAYIRNEADELHEIVTSETRKTRGQVLYQEQMMRILRKAGLDWADVTAVRKLVTKKEGYEKLEAIKNRFMEFFGTDTELGDDVWHATVGGAGYGFNISHACSYSHITYYCMYLKVHYPLQFYWANMFVEPGKVELLREFQQAGGKILGVKVGRSKMSWSIDKGGLRAGYLTLKGIGPVSAEKLEAGDIPKGTTRSVLEAAGAFEPEEGTDYLGLDELGRRLECIQGRDKIEEIQPGNWVRIAGVITQFKVKNLREYYDKNGKDYGEVNDPEKCLYVNMKLSDESAEITVSVGRYMYSDPLISDILNNRKSDTIFIIVGERVKDAEKVRATRISLLEDEFQDADEVFSGGGN